LKDSISTYRELGATQRENEMVALRADVVEAYRGVNPLTLERTSTRRRDMQRTVALHVLRVSGDQLRADYREVEASLADLRSQLAPLALYSLQTGIAATGEVAPADLERIWNLLSQDTKSSAAVKQVEMSFASLDALLVLGDLLALSR